MVQSYEKYTVDVVCGEKNPAFEDKIGRWWNVLFEMRDFFDKKYWLIVSFLFEKYYFCKR